jgi:hypothetical protein
VPSGRRGPRREEVAALAGLSIDYYIRLEQGEESNPSGPSWTCSPALSG